MYRKLLALNGMAILAVVLNHAAGEGFTAMFWWAHRYRLVVSPNYDMLGSPTYYALTLLQQITMFSVPAFLFISGYFVAYAAKSRYPGLSWRVVRTRIYRLLWPYIIWSILIFVWNALINGEVFSPLEYARRLTFGGATGAYFFIPLLCQYYLVSPWLVRIAKNRPGWLLFLVIALQVLSISLFYLKVRGFVISGSIIKSAWLFISNALYFTSGLVICLRTNEIIMRIKRFKKVLIGCTLLFAVASIVENEIINQLSSSLAYSGSPMKFTSALFGLSFILTYISFDATENRSARYLTTIGTLSYGIYLVHPELIILLSRIIYHLAPYLLSLQLFFATILFVLGMGISILVVEGVRRSSFRRAYRYIFG